MHLRIKVAMHGWIWSGFRVEEHHTVMVIGKLWAAQVAEGIGYSVKYWMT